MQDLAFLYEVANRPSNILDRHRGIDAVLVEQVNVVRAKPPQAALDGSLKVLRRAVQPADLPDIRINLIAELGCYDDLVPHASQGLADDRRFGWGKFGLTPRPEAEWLRALRGVSLRRLATFLR